MPPEMQAPITEETQETAQVSPEKELSDDEVAATLGYITTINEQMMPKPEMGLPASSPEEAPQEVSEATPMPDPRVDELEKEFKELETRVEETIDLKMNEIKDMLEDALKDDE